MAVLLTAFGKSLIFQLLVLLENRNRNGHTQTAPLLVICPLTSIINDQICEVESMGLSTCNLSEKLALDGFLPNNRLVIKILTHSLLQSNH